MGVNYDVNRGQPLPHGWGLFTNPCNCLFPTVTVETPSWRFPSGCFQGEFFKIQLPFTIRQTFRSHMP